MGNGFRTGLAAAVIAAALAVPTVASAMTTKTYTGYADFAGGVELDVRVDDRGVPKRIIAFRGTALMGMCSESGKGPAYRQFQAPIKVDRDGDFSYRHRTSPYGFRTTLAGRFTSKRDVIGRFTDTWLSSNEDCGVAVSFSARRVSGGVPGPRACAPQTNGDCAYKPRIVGLGADSYARIKRWRHWGAGWTAGIGRVKYRAPDGGIKGLPAKVIYNQPTWCEGGRMTYTHLKVLVGKPKKNVWTEVEIVNPCGYERAQ